MTGMNETWREGRKILDRSLRSGAVISYRQMMQEKTREFLARLHANPKDLHAHIELSVGLLPHIFCLLTVRQPSGKTYHVTHVWLRPEGWRQNTRSAGSGNQYNVTALHAWSSISKSPPILCGFRLHPCYVGNSSQLFSVRHIPSWVPYLSYEPLARTVRKLSERTKNEPIEFVKNALVCGDRGPDIQAS
jgi:hypothetical protein